MFLTKLLNSQLWRIIYSSFLKSLKNFCQVVRKHSLSEGKKIYFWNNPNCPECRAEKKFQYLQTEVAADLDKWRNSTDLNRYIIFYDLLLSSLRVSGKDRAASLWRKEVSKLSSWLKCPRIKQQWWQFHSSAFLLGCGGPRQDSALSCAVPSCWNVHSHLSISAALCPDCFQTALCLDFCSYWLCWILPALHKVRWSFKIERRDSSSLLMLKYIVELSVHSFGFNLSWANRSSLFHS